MVKVKRKERLINLNKKNLLELNNEKIFLLKQQFILRMQKGSNKLSHNHMFSLIRKDIARINTLISLKNKKNMVIN